MKLSIVTTMYMSAPYLHEFYSRAKEVALKNISESENKNYEIIFVNDGSPDNSLDLAIEISKNDSTVIVIDLSRNFGHHKAMMTGLSYAKGEYVFLIDCDLEEEPEWLNLFKNIMHHESCDVVYGVQKKRKGNFVEQWSGLLFYLILKPLTGLNIPENVTTARLMTKRYVRALLRHREREVFMAGLWYITGFKQTPFIVEKHNTSETTYTLNKKIALLINSITSFSNTPLVSIFYIGLIISGLSIFYIFCLIIDKLFFTKILSGWTSVMASIWLLGGMIISFIGVIGIYLSKIFSETKKRPYTIVRQIYEKSKK